MIVTHENGYTAKLYGKSSMIVYRPNGRQMLHTGSRNLESQEDVLAFLDDMPEFDKNSNKLFSDDIGDFE